MPLLPENVQGYPRPPALERIVDRIEIWLAGECIARTEDAFRVLETHHAPTYYLPPRDIAGALRPTGRKTVCEWKGAAQFFDLHVVGRTVRRAAWCYPDPWPPFGPLAGHVAFYAGPMLSCTVDGQVAKPQPGGFYGGWVTPNLLGTPKGAAGTEHW